MNNYDNFIVHLKLSTKIDEYKEDFCQEMDEIVENLDNKNFLDFIKILVPVLDNIDYDEEIIDILLCKLEKFTKNLYLLDSLIGYLINNRKFGYHKLLLPLVDKLLDEDTVGFFMFNSKNHKFPIVAKKKILAYYKSNVQNYLIDLDKLVIPEEEIFHFKKENKKLKQVFVQHLSKVYSKDIVVEHNLRWRNDTTSYFERVENRRGLRYIRKQIKEFIENSPSNLLIIKMSLNNNCNKSKFHENCEEKHCHRNLLIFDKRDKVLERYEPLGKFSSEKYNVDEMDKQLFEYFEKKDINYIGTKNNLYFGVQRIQSDCPINKKFKKSGEPGRCIAWCLCYAEILLKNEIFSGDRYHINKLLFYYFVENKVILTNYIRNYTTKILKIKY